MLSANVKRAVKAIVRFIDDKDPRVALKAAELLLDRAYGKPQNQAAHVAFDTPGSADDLDGVLVVHRALIRAATKGEIALEDASEFSGLLETHRRMVETVDLEARIIKLEGAVDDES